MKNDEQKKVSDATAMRVSLTEGSITHALTGMAVPMAVGILATMSFNMVDTFFVSGLGDDALAAISFTFPVVMFVLSLSVGLGAGVSSVLAREAGKGDEYAIKSTVTDGLLLSLLISGVLSVVGYLTIDPLFALLGAKWHVMPMVRDYMAVWYWSVPFFIVPMVGGSALRALGNSKLPGLMMIAMAIFNAVLDPFLIYGWWIFPRLEIEGAALASLIVRGVSFVLTFYILIVKMRLLISLCDLKRIIGSWKKILHVGVPAMATNLIIPISSALIVALIAVHGSDAVAGFGVAARVESMALILFYALSSVIGPFYGQNLGAGKFQRLFDSQKITARFCLVAGVLIACALALLGPLIARQFSDEAAVIEVTVYYLWLVPLSYCAYGIVMTVNASFNGIGKPMPGVVISSARVVFVLLPLAWIGSYFYGVIGIFMAMTFSNLLVGFAAHIWIRRVVEKEMSVAHL